MAGFGGAVKLTGESEYRKALKQITQSLKEVDSELKVVTSQYDKTDRSQEALAAQSETLAKKYDAQALKVKALSDNYKSLEAQAAKNKAAHASLKSELDTESAKLKEIEAESGKTSDAYKDQADKVNQLSADYKKSQAAIDDQDAALSRARVELNNATAAMNTTRSTLDGLSAEMDQNAESADDLGNEVKKAGDDAESAGNGGFTILKGALADLASSAIQSALSGIRDLGSAIFDLGKQSITSYADYEQLVGGVEKIFGTGGQTLDEYARQLGVIPAAAIDSYRMLERTQSQIMTDAANAYMDLNMSANDYIAAINTAGATFAQTMGAQEGYDVARQGMLAIADYASGTGKSVEELTDKYQMITRSASSYQSIADQFAGILPQTSADFLAQAQAAGYLSEEYESLTDVPVAEYQQAVTDMLTQGVDALGLAGNTAAETANTLSGSLAAVSATWSNLITGLADDSADLDTLIGNFSSSLLNTARLITPRIQSVIEGFGTLASTLVEELVPELINMIPPLLETSLPILISAVESTLSAILSILPEVIPIISRLIPQICTSLVSMLPLVLSAGIEIILSLISGISDAIPQLLAMLPTLVSEISGVLLDNLGLIISTGVDLLVALIQGISEATPQLIDMLPDLVEQVSLAILDNLPLILNCGYELINSLISGIGRMLPSLLTSADQVMKRAASTLISNLPQILSIGKDIINSIIRGQLSMLVNLTNTVKNIFNTVKNKFAELPDELVTIGSNLVRGLWNGISDMTSWVIGKIQGFGESVLDGIRDFFGIASPSKLFENEVGKYLAEGIGVGFEDEMRSVSEDMQDAIPTSFDVGTNVNASGSLGGGLDYFSLVNAFKTALEDMTVELDDVTVGKFIQKTVTDAIYT